MKVYVITSGCYSDYRIRGITLKKHIAKKLKLLYREDREVRIEEYETNDFERILFENSQGRFPYEVTFKQNEWRTYSVYDPIVKDYGSYSITKERGFECWCYAKDENHALKIAQDLYLQLKANEHAPKKGKF